MRLDLRVDNAEVHTLDPARPRARSLGIWHGLVAGLDDDLAGLPAREVLDAGGATIVPGFLDAHTHLAWAGLAARAVDLSGARSVDDVRERIARAAATVPPGGWIDAAGYDQRPLGRHLDRHDLDAAAAGRRVYVQHRSGHAVVVNSPVLAQLAAVGAGPGDGVELDEAGEPTGLLVEQGTLLARRVRLPYSVAELVDAVEHSARQCASEGVTMVAEAGIGEGLLGHSPVELAAYQHARDEARLPLRVQLMVASASVHPLAAHADDPVRRGLDLGARTGLGDDRLGLGALKVYLDGGMMARTAALSAPYRGGGPGGDAWGCGMLHDTPGALADVIVEGHAAGWQLAVHAIGDRAVDVALDAIEEAQRRRPLPDRRHRIEHSGMTRPDQLDRYARSGIIPVVQPSFLYRYGDDYADVLGPDREGWMYRGRGFLDRGIPVVGSSDRPVADGAPLRGMAFMTDRRSVSGRVIGADEALTASQALAAYTTAAAFACRAEGRVGRLAPGMAADFVVLDADPLARGADLAAVGVAATYVGGRATFLRPGG